jgi:hypothetical protein
MSEREVLNHSNVSREICCGWTVGPSLCVGCPCFLGLWSHHRCITFTRQMINEPQSEISFVKGYVWWVVIFLYGINSHSKAFWQRELRKQLIHHYLFMSVKGCKSVGILDMPLLCFLYWLVYLISLYRQCCLNTLINDVRFICRFLLSLKLKDLNFFFITGRFVW